MRYREFVVLDAVNIATTRFARRKPAFRYEATAAQIAEIVNTDPRIRDEFSGQMTPLEVGAVLRRLACGPPVRFEPLVKKLNSRKWCLTSAGARWLGA